MEKIENKRVLQGYYSKIILNIVFLIIFLIIIIQIAIPGYDEYKSTKENLLVKINDYENIQKKWLEFSDFTSLITESSTKEIVDKIWVEFFNNNLKNSTPKSYLEFLKEKETKVNELKKSDKIKLRDEKISKVLPSYQEWISVDGSMTDLEFVNYIESLLRNFRLITSSRIWIENLLLVENKNTININKSRDSLSSQIFYIPLKLEIEWAKADIVDFLYFLQNVWKVNEVKDNDITFYKDNLINKKLSKNINSNLYENKIVDISSIEFKDYIDTSSFIRNSLEKKDSLWFLNFIRNGVEKDQSYKIDLSLKFYVKWLPTYKIETYIQKTISLYSTLLNSTTNNLKNIQSKKIGDIWNDTIIIVSNLRAIQTYLIDLDSNINRLKAWLKEANNLEWLYIDASKTRYDIDNIQSILNDNLQKIKSLPRKK